MHAGVFPNPILPMITDSEESLDALAAAARQAGAQYFGGGPLFLMPSAQKIFFPFLEQRFPKLAGPYRKLYARERLPRPRLQGAVARARGAHSRAARPGFRAGRVSSRTVGRRRAGHAVSATVKSGRQDGSRRIRFRAARGSDRAGAARRPRRFAHAGGRSRARRLGRPAVSRSARVPRRRATAWC